MTGLDTGLGSTTEQDVLIENFNIVNIIKERNFRILLANLVICVVKPNDYCMGYIVTFFVMCVVCGRDPPSIKSYGNMINNGITA